MAKVFQLTLLALVGLSSAARSPIVMVPGLVSSVLNAEIKDREPFQSRLCAFCKRNSKRYTLWVSSVQFVRPCCLIENLGFKIEEGGRTVPPRGLNVTPAPGLDGLRFINPHDPVPIDVYDQLFNVLTDAGWKADDTLRAFTYDWRRYGDPVFTKTMFGDLRAEIEDVTAKYGKAKLMCHSMGCPLLHMFLASFVSPQWKKTHVEGLLALGPAWAGSAQLAKNVIDGPTYPQLPTSLTRLFRKASATWPSLLTLLPTNLDGMKIWDDNDGFISTPTQNYTVADTEMLLQEMATETTDAKDITKFLPWMRSHSWNQTIGPPGVPLTCVYVADTDTPTGYRFGSRKWDTVSKIDITGMGPGDGTVNIKSMEVPCKTWGGKISALKLNGKVSHVDMLNNDEVKQLVLEFAK